MKKPPAKKVTLRKPDGSNQTIELALGDFNYLNRVAREPVQVKAAEKDFARCQRWGLVRHRFEDKGGWPIAIVILTPEGRQALTQEFA